MPYLGSVWFIANRAAKPTYGVFLVPYINLQCRKLVVIIIMPGWAEPRGIRSLFVCVIPSVTSIPHCLLKTKC